MVRTTPGAGAAPTGREDVVGHQGRGAHVRTGCDLQPVADVADAVRAFGPRYLDRVYTPREQEDCRRGGAAPLAASLAARFAAKEAVLKLIGEPDGVDLRCVETCTRHGRPVVRLSGRAADLAAAAGLGDIDVSLSHAAGLAMAVAVATAPAAPDTAAAPAPDTDPRGTHRHD